MTHYQELALLTFRIIGMVFWVIAAVTALFSLTAPFFGYQTGTIVLFLIIYSLPLSIFGAVFWLTGKKLAQLVCFGLGNIDEK